MKTNKGFIQIPVLIWIIIGAFAVGGGGYIGVNKYQESKTKEAEKNIAIETLSRQVEELKTQQSTNTKENDAQKTQPKVTERIIEKPVIVENNITDTGPASKVQVSQPATPNITDVKKVERQAFDIFWQNSQKAINEFGEATKYLVSAMNSASGSTGSIASTYAQNSIDACNSGSQVNLTNSIPSLPFSSDLTQVNQIIATLGAKCKQMAQAYQESFKYSTNIHSDNYNPYKAKDLVIQAESLMDEYFSIRKNELVPISDKISQKAEAYFN